MDHFVCTSQKSKSFFSINYQHPMIRIIQQGFTKSCVLPILKNIQHPPAHSPNKKFLLLSNFIKKITLSADPCKYKCSCQVQWNKKKLSLCWLKVWTANSCEQKYSCWVEWNEKNTVVMYCIYKQDVYAIN